jgi:hypothetical protein
MFIVNEDLQVIVETTGLVIKPEIHQGGTSFINRIVIFG